MPSKIHYEDNLFYLHSILRTVDSGLKLDIDPELFKDKVIEDIFFIDASLVRLFGSLKDSPYLINRTNHLRSMRRMSVALDEFLARLNSGGLPFSESVQDYHERLGHLQAAYARMTQDIDVLLDQEVVDEDSSRLVSSREYDFLLASDEASGPDAVTNLDSDS